MRWHELLEGRLAPLYHGTSLSAAIEMLHENTLWAGTSLSRSYDVAGNFADKTPMKLDDNKGSLTPLGKLEYEADLGTCAIIAFDQAKLMHNCGLKPYNWFYGNCLDDWIDGYKRGEEMEEVTQRNASPVTKFIIGIDAQGFEQFAPLVVEKLPTFAPTVQLMKTLLHRPGIFNRFDRVA